jgi:hypothetical protein
VLLKPSKSISTILGSLCKIRKENNLTPTSRQVSKNCCWIERNFCKIIGKAKADAAMQVM